MATQGPLYPSTTASLANAGTSENSDAWTSTANIVSDNATEASITAATYDSPDISQLLVASNFGFTIPAGSTINGITVEIDRRDGGIGAASDNRVQLATGITFADLVGTNKADLPLDWPTASTNKVYGGAADTWTAGLTVAQINAAGFAVMLSVQADAANTDIFVDYIRVTVNYTAPAVVSGSLTADAYIRRNDIAGSFTADSNIKATPTASVTANSNIKATLAGSLTADAYIKTVVSASATSDSYIRATTTGSFTANAETAAAIPVWVSPADTSTITSTPVFVFTLPVSIANGTHAHMEIDTANTFNTGNLRSLKTNVSTTGWEYWNGTVWVAYPSSGVPIAYAGNNARYTVQTPLSSGTWYRRVRTGA